MRTASVEIAMAGKPMTAEEYMKELRTFFARVDASMNDVDQRIAVLQDTKEKLSSLRCQLKITFDVLDPKGDRA